MLVRDHGARHESGQLIVPAQLALPLGVEVHQRAPAAGDCQQVAGDLFDAGGEFAVVVDAADGDGVQAAGAVRSGIGHRAADQHPGAGADGGGGHLREARAGVDDGRHLDAGGAQVRGEGVGAVVGGADDHAVPGGDGVAVEVAADGGGQHDPGAVVVLEDQGALVGAGCQHHLIGTHVPNTLTGDAGCRRAGQVVGAVLDSDDVVGVVGTEGGRAVQDGGLGTGNQFGFDVRRPFQGRLAFNDLGQARSRGP